jgi:hypothetical protein
MPDIPLNYFVRKTITLSPITTGAYTAPFDRASIILAAYASNYTAGDVTITVGISGKGGTFVDPRPYYDHVKSFTIPSFDTINIAPARLLLEQFDVLIASCNTVNSCNLNLSILETLNTLT